MSKNKREQQEKDALKQRLRDLAEGAIGDYEHLCGIPNPAPWQKRILLADGTPAL
jgi:hypothetical protein